jgi:hypothetical protein
MDRAGEARAAHAGWEGELNTPAGQALRRVIELRLVTLRATLEGEQCSNEEGQRTRGAIRELKTLLAGGLPMVSVPRYSGMDFNKGRGNG